jgi:hypothetical protein
VIVDRQGPDAALDAAGQPTYRLELAASPNTYSDELCLALYEIRLIVTCGSGDLGVCQLERTERAVLA